MRKLFLISMMISLVLSACAAKNPAATEQPSAVPTVPAPTQAAPTAAPVEPEAPVGGAVIYKIVAGESTATYEVGETFFSDNRFNLAVGMTPHVSGEIQLDPANPQAASVGQITVDVSQLKSDSNRRDGRIKQDWLESSRFPLATFKPTAIDGLPATYTEGQPITFTITGDLTVKETTKPVTFDVTAKLQNGALSGVATTTVLLSDFAVGPIEIAGMLGTEDEARLTLTFLARP